MSHLEVLRELAQPAEGRMVLFVADGLGGLPREPGGPTELEAARTPHLDRLAAEGTVGLTIPVRPGVPPGSGPGHLALFGYDPVECQVGRGVLEALGVGFPLRPEDVAARGNFATLDPQGRVSDRRAGRLPSDEAAALCRRLQEEVRLEGAELFVWPVKEHRLLVVLRGEGLDPSVQETDPLQEGKQPLAAVALRPEAERAASLFREFVRQAGEVLRAAERAQAVNLRGYAKLPDWPRWPELYGLRAGAIAAYPMYRGVARLVGMEVLGQPAGLEEELALLERRWEDFDFFFIHFKDPDRKGEDGDFEGKVRAIEEADQAVGSILALAPAVVAVTGDHSTPAAYRSHSWHPVPVVLWAPGTARPDGASGFGEGECRRGGLGIFPAYQLLGLMLGHAGRLTRFGA